MRSGKNINMIVSWLSVINKVGPLLIAGTYVVFNGYITENNNQEIKFGICMLLILCLIWFGEQLGSFTGYIGRGGNIDAETPGWLVCTMGWIFLIGIPVLLFVLNRG